MSAVLGLLRLPRRLSGSNRELVSLEGKGREANEDGAGAEPRGLSFGSISPDTSLASGVCQAAVRVASAGRLLCQFMSL